MAIAKEREEVLSSAGYWLYKIQEDLYVQLDDFMEENGLNQSQLAEKLGVSKGYVSQILNADFDHKLSKLVSLSLAIGKVPIVEYKDLKQVFKDDELEKIRLDKGEREIVFQMTATHSTNTVEINEDIIRYA